MNLPFHIDLSRLSGKRLAPDPERDWLILLSAALLLLSASALGNALLYKDAVAGAPIGSEQVSTAALPEDALSKVDAVFAARAAELEKYENGAYPFVDPSK